MDSKWANALPRMETDTTVSSSPPNLVDVEVSGRECSTPHDFSFGDGPVVQDYANVVFDLMTEDAGKGMGDCPLPTEDRRYWNVPGHPDYEETMIEEAFTSLRNQTTCFFQSPIPSFLPDNTLRQIVADSLTIKDLCTILFKAESNDIIYVFNHRQDRMIGTIDTYTALKLMLLLWFLHKSTESKQNAIWRLHLCVAALSLHYTKELELPESLHPLAPDLHNEWKYEDRSQELKKSKEKSIKIAKQILETNQWDWELLHLLLPRYPLPWPAININMYTWPEFRSTFLSHASYASDETINSDISFKLMEMYNAHRDPTNEDTNNVHTSYIKRLIQKTRLLKGPFHSRLKKDSPWMMTTSTFMNLIDRSRHIPFMAINRSAIDAALMLLHLDLPSDVAVWSNSCGTPVARISPADLLSQYISNMRGEGLEGLLLRVRKFLKIGSWGHSVLTMKVSSPIYALIDVIISRQWSSVPVVDGTGRLVRCISQNALLRMFQAPFESSSASNDVDHNYFGIDLNSPISSFIPTDQAGNMKYVSVCTFESDEGAPGQDYSNAKTIRTALEKGTLSSISISTVTESPYLVFGSDPLLGYTSRFIPEFMTFPNVMNYRKPFPATRTIDAENTDGNHTRSTSVGVSCTADELKKELYVPCAVTDDDLSIRELITVLTFSDDHRCIFVEPSTGRVRGLITQKEILRAILQNIPWRSVTTTKASQIKDDNTETQEQLNCSCAMLMNGVDVTEVPQIVTPRRRTVCKYDSKNASSWSTDELLLEKRILEPDERVQISRDIPNTTCVSVARTFKRLYDRKHENGEGFL